MSSKSGHSWSFTILRFRTLLLQIFPKIHTSAPAGRVPQPPQGSSVAMVPYSFRSFGSPAYMSSLLGSYCTRVKQNQEKDQPSTTAIFFLPSWAKWIFGSLLSLLVPSWNKFQALEDEAEKVMEEAESVAEVVEKVAELTEKVSAEIAEKLPEKSKLKEAAQVVQNYSKEIAHDAHLTQHVLHKVEEWKQKLDTEQIKKKEGIVNK